MGFEYGLIVDHPATLLSLGNFQITETLLAALGFLIITGYYRGAFPVRSCLVPDSTVIGLGVRNIKAWYRRRLLLRPCWAN